MVLGPCAFEGSGDCHGPPLGINRRAAGRVSRRSIPSPLTTPEPSDGTCRGNQPVAHADAAVSPTSVGLRIVKTIRHERTLKQSLLALQCPERAQIRHREGKPVLILIPRAEIQARELYAEPAAVGVVSGLHNGVLQDALLVIVNGHNRRVPTAPRLVADPEAGAHLVLTRQQV